MKSKYQPKLINLLICVILLCSTGNSAVLAGTKSYARSELTDAGEVGNPWSHFSALDGLASNSVFALDVAADGKLWVGTNSGVSILAPDNSWLTLTDADGLGGNIVSDIAPDPTNAQRHWFATDGGGTLLDDGGNAFDKNNDTWITFGKSDGLVERYVSTIAIDASANIWFGTNFFDNEANESGYGISVLNLNGTPFTKTDDSWTTYTSSNSNLSNNVIHKILVDKQGVIWIATQSGLNAYSNGIWTTYFSTDGLASNNVTNLLAVGNVLWVGTKNGISVLSGSDTAHNKTDDQWMTYNQSNSGLADNDTAGLAVDGNGRIWISTDQTTNNGEAGAGVSVLDSAGTPLNHLDDSWKTFTTASGLADNAVRTLATLADNGVWFGTQAGLSHLNYGSSPYSASDDRWITHTSTNQLAGNSVYTIAEADIHMTWFGTDQGVSLLNDAATPHAKQDDSWVNYTATDGLAAGSVRALAVDSKGRLWIGTAAGLTVLDTKRTATKKDDSLITYTSSTGLAHDQVNDIVIDSTGRAWIACGSYFGGGLHALDLGVGLTNRNDDSWSTFTPLNSSLPAPYATALVLMPGNNIWVGTNNGAARLNDAGSPFNKADDIWTIFTTSNSGLLYNSVRDITVDRAGNVWFGLALEGINAYAIDGTWLNFKQADGLVYDAVHTVNVDRAGNLWFGTDGGGISLLNYAGTLGDKADDSWTTYKPGETLPSGNIRTIMVDSWGQIWVGMFGGGASVYSTQTFSQLYLPLIARGR